MLKIWMRVIHECPFQKQQREAARAKAQGAIALKDKKGKNLKKYSHLIVVAKNTIYTML